MKEPAKTQFPRSPKWVNINDRKPYEGARCVFYGKVNIGSPHEAWSEIFGRYEPSLVNHFIDLHGDGIEADITHFLEF